MHRNIHYEAAFEDYLRKRSWPYVAVDEAKKAAISSGVYIKNFDFIVYSSSGPNLLVDVKGRKFPDTAAGAKRGGLRAWENWITQQDVDGLGQWETIFGPEFAGMLVFTYWLQGPPHRSPFEDVHFFRDKHYSFMAMPLRKYVLSAKQRSSRWQTIGIPASEFAKQAVEIASIL